MRRKKNRVITYQSETRNIIGTVVIRTMIIISLRCVIALTMSNAAVVCFDQRCAVSYAHVCTLLLQPFETVFFGVIG